MVEECAVFNTACASVALAIGFAFVVDCLAREVNVLVTKCRLWAFVMLSFATTYSALEGDQSQSIFVAIVLRMYFGAAMITALYFCEIFYDVFFNLKN